MLVRLAVDFENPARSWWDNGGQDLWDGIAEAFDGSNVVLEASLATSWLARAELISGWHGGPDYAPHPVRLQQVEDDEDV